MPEPSTDTMNTELAITTPSQIVPKEDGNVTVTALQSNDMPRCQEALRAWARNKVLTLDSDVTELQAAYDHAKAKKWKTSVLQRHLGIAKKRAEFYRKIMLALEAGYVIVPNFPVQAFAIRTLRDKPKDEYKLEVWAADFKQDPQCPDAGEGEYQNPFPKVACYDSGDKTANGRVLLEQYPTGWDEMDFPLSMAKGEIMEATDRAMALKIFDDIGILPKARKEDPIIVGQVHLKGAYGFAKTVTFMIAWHLDTRVL